MVLGEHSEADDDGSVDENSRFDFGPSLYAQHRDDVCYSLRPK